jgi:hypothetical protein
MVLSAGVEGTEVRIIPERVVSLLGQMGCEVLDFDVG